MVLYFGNDYLRGHDPAGPSERGSLPPAQQSADAPASTGANTGSARDVAADDTALIGRAFTEQRSDVWVQASGEVIRTLADDNEGSRHQRFLIRLSNGITILIAHNIDLAPRIPLGRGDEVEFRGEYEWNDKGGVIHWTHHDPRGRKQGGWITHRQKKYE
ncbi:MAG: DUF3465 domain-containing protein [Gammaproteobacteria bacterium]|nr:DUF3465 domain-containing protein [Gammaproteobacteria bacterium]